MGMDWPVAMHWFLGKPLKYATEWCAIEFIVADFETDSDLNFLIMWFFVTHADGSFVVKVISDVYASVHLFVFPHSISKTITARITILDRHGPL